MKRILFISILSFITFLSAGIASAQTLRLTPATVSVAQNGNFSLNLSIDSATNVFAVYFDLDYNPNLLTFVDATEGTFLSQGCQTAFANSEIPAGKLIVGLTRLGDTCSGISGSGALMTLNFRALQQNGSTSMNFTNNGITVYDSAFSDIVGTWVGATVTVGGVTGDTTAPAPPGGVQVT